MIKDTNKISILIQNYLISIICDNLYFSNIDDLRNFYLDIHIEENDEKNNSSIYKAVVGEEIIITAVQKESSFTCESIISKVIGNFFLVDMPFLPCSGIIYSNSQEFIIGFLLPAKVPHGFMLGMALSNYLPYLITKSSKQTIYPVFPVFSRMQGSAVAITENLLITSAHVVKEANNIKILNISPYPKENLRGEVNKIGKILDLALVITQSPLNYCKLAQRFYEGEKITCVGYGFFDLKEPLITQGYLSKIVYYCGYPVIAMISAKTFNGQSGGGVFNSNSELIGIITANAHNQNDRIYEDLGFCILNTMFSSLSKEENIQAYRKLPYLWEEESKSFNDLFTFQTTTYLPSPKL